MGAYQSVVRLVAQDYEFDNLFAKYYIDKLGKDADKSYIGDTVTTFNYTISDKKKLTGKPLAAKMYLAKYLGFENFTDLSSSESIENFTDILKEDLSPFSDEDGYTVELILTGHCASFVNIIAKLIKEEYIHPAYVTLYVVNEKHNGARLAEAIKNMNMACEINNSTLSINEFNSLSSMGENTLQWTDNFTASELIDFIPDNCKTTNEFKNTIKTMSADGNCLANALINYSVSVNSELIKGLGVKIAHNIYKVINVDEVVCKRGKLSSCEAQLKNIMKDVVRQYRLLTNPSCILDKHVLYVKISDNLSKVKIIIELLKNTINISDNILTNEKNQLQKKLVSVISWLNAHIGILKSELIQFPIHNMAVVLMLDGGNHFTKINAYGCECGQFFNIVKDQSDETFTDIVHHITKNPKLTKTVLEKMILDVVRNYKVNQQA
jgi:hypothetical protein